MSSSFVMLNMAGIDSTLPNSDVLRRALFFAFSALLTSMVGVAALMSAHGA